MDDIESKLNSLFSSPESMERIMQLAKSLSGSEAKGEARETSQESAPALDPKLMSIIGSALGEFSNKGDTERLAGALKPFLSAERAERLDRAMGIARIARVAKKVIPELGGGGGLV